MTTRSCIGLLLISLALPAAIPVRAEEQETTIYQDLLVSPSKIKARDLGTLTLAPWLDLPAESSGPPYEWTVQQDCFLLAERGAAKKPVKKVKGNWRTYLYHLDATGALVQEHLAGGRFKTERDGIAEFFAVLEIFFQSLPGSAWLHTEAYATNKKKLNAMLLDCEQEAFGG